MEVPRITPREVAERIERGDPVAFLDARSAASHAASHEEIPGSIRVPPDAVDDHLAEIPRGAVLVAYCT